MRYQIWNRTDTLYTPVADVNGKGSYTPPEYIAVKAPWMANPAAKAIITTGAINCAVFQEFEKTKDFVLGMVCEHIAAKDQTTGDHILAVFPILVALDINWEDQTASAAAMAWWAGVEDGVVLELMEWLEDNPLQIPSPETLEATASERIAAALEFQNLMSLSDA